MAGRRISLTFKTSASEAKSPYSESTQTVTGLFHQQAKLNPRDTAIEVDNEGVTTYAQLDRQSSVVASSLPAGSVIAVCLDRSSQLLVSVLAILKAGSAYVILDPDAPTRRNTLIAEDVNAAAVLTSAAYVSRFPGAAIVVDTLLKQTPTTAKLPKPLPSIDPSSAAYIIYTSGSSGKPKGVVISHRAAAHGIGHFSLNAHQRWLFFYNPIFSAAQRTMLATLCKGGILCIATKEAMTTSLMSVVARMNVNAIGLTPSMLVTTTPGQIPACLRQITCVGEPVSQNLADAFADKVELRVSYGLSECAQLNFGRRLARGDNPALVGKPTDTTEAIILRPGTTEFVTSAGETGELCLIGPQLADGYLNRPVETALSFVSNPFGPGMMFRTGDLARLSPSSNGEFEILGRVDNQVKINGQRLEPEEVASVLAQHPAVAHAHVVAANVKGIKSLVAAVVLSQGQEWSTAVAEMRLATQNVLPAYMVPSYWIQYAELPLNRNGKVDRHAVRERVESASMEELLGRSRSAGNLQEMVEDPVEKIIQGVWADVLALDAASIGRSDAFFDLGGSSLQAIQMLNELRRRDVYLTLEAMFHDRELVQSLRSESGVVDAFPATDFQESLVGITLQGSADYTYQRVWDIRDLDPVRLRLALHVAFLKSQTLRTSFIHSDSGLVQTVRSDMEFPLQVLETALEQYRKEDLEKGFTLGEPFFRAAMLQGSILVVTMHHALFDYWSHSFLYDDVAMYYRGLQPAPRPGFQRFVAEMLKTDWSPSEIFWRENLETTAPSVLNFAPTPQTTSLGRSFGIDLNQVAASHGVTVGSILYTAWALVLAKQLGSNDVVYAAPLSGRETPLLDIDRLDGPTLTVVPLRFVFGTDQRLAEAIQTGHALTVDALKHSQYGLRKILRAASQKADLFDTMLNILPVQNKADNNSTGSVFKVYGDKPAWKTEYTTLEIEPSADGSVSARLSSTMEPERAGFILDQFVMVIQMMLHEPQRPVSAINLITETETNMLSRTADMPSNLPATMLTRYDEMVARYPHRIAVQWQTLESISYLDFDQRTNQLARYLVRNVGVRKGDFVCLMLEKSPMMIMAIWAVLKAGAAYVPLSSENPVDRNRFIVEEVGASIVLSEKGVEQAGELDAPVLLLSESLFAGLDKSPPGTDIDSQSIAYVIYTSGSTGRPKGVLIPHGAGAAAIDSMAAFEGRRRGCWRVLQFSNYIFDASMIDIFNTLTSGGTLCMAPQERLMSELADVMNEMMVTHSFFTPTVARLLSPKDVPNLRSLCVGGEALTEDIIKIWGRDCAIVQAYGPSETAIVVTMRDMEIDHRSNNIGKPLVTTQAFILERDGTGLVPYGAIGELCIAGPQLGAGYLNRPETTAQAFITVDTISGEPISLYRTGDLARWLPGGDLQYLGRKDHQVKVNGHRIELGEIERAIMVAGEESDLADCVAVVAAVEGKPQIAAYVLFHPSSSAASAQGSSSGIQDPEEFVDHVNEIRSKLTGLAHYMYPKIVLPVPALPLMPSGKTNRKLLVAWVEKLDAADISRYYFDFFGGGGTVVAAETKAERFVEEAFSAILKVSRDALGKTSNFLALGGDSISAITLASYVRKHGYTLSVSTILKYPLLQDMAQQVGIADEGTDSESGWTVVEFEPPQAVHDQIHSAGMSQDEVEYIYPCPPGQAEFLSQGAKDTQGWVLQAVRPFPSAHDLQAWAAVVVKLTETNDILRTTFTQLNGTWYGVVLKSSGIVLDILDVASETERQSAIDAIYASSFRFGAPFIRYAAIRLPSGETSILTKMDHALYDGTLLRIFAGHFKSLQQNNEPGAVEVLSPFRSFALHLHSLTREKAAALEYFTTSHAPSLVPQFPSIPSPSATHTVFSPGPASLTGVDTFSTSAGITTPILFQAAFQAWLSRQTGRRRVGLDYLYTGRNVALPSPQDINGCTANFVPLQASVCGTLKEYLNHTQDEFWATTEHGVVSLQEIFDANHISREKACNGCLFLFQPFEPSPPRKEGEKEEMKWVVMAGSQARMMQPYGLVVEVIKLPVPGQHKLKITYDPRAFSEDGAKRCGREIWEILEGMIEGGLEVDVEDLL
ncbi:nonribosomal peptide synthase side [Podospora didyma]|uniref:Nonribosomal peptide synthase side n=1 Tax=Podospora didyma TaxID=330526 RepID=A0AAE0K2A8_9PEZI|nr:nonribosomal peptide synthase side [Podospora didyma]